MKLLKLLLVALVLAFASGCAPTQAKVEQKVTAEPEVYEEIPITPGRYLSYLQYRRTLSLPLSGAPKIEVTRQSLLSSECGVCVINSIGKFFNTEWKYDEIKKAVHGTHTSGTSIAAIVKWFNDKGYSKVKLYEYERRREVFLGELSDGALIIPLIYAFRDGFGPNHFVIVSYSDGQMVNVLDSRIGEYSESLDFFLSKQVLVLGQWIAVKP